MSSVQLLDKTRKIGNLLHNNNAPKVVFNDICAVVTEVLLSNVLVISKKGKVLGASSHDSTPELTELLSGQVGTHVDEALNTRLLGILSTKENARLATLGFENDEMSSYAATIIPIYIAGERLGTLFVYRAGNEYDIDDIILCEYAVTVVGLEMLRSVNEEYEEENRKAEVVRSAIHTLSMSEMDAARHIFAELDGREGLLVASRIADRYGITRSVIVNALRKFESAGVIESRSSGMKGTFIRIKNEAVLDALDEAGNWKKEHV